jgi:hypothetical protein
VKNLPPTWQRLVLSIIGVLVIQVSWRWAVCHLYTLPTPALAGFVTITTNSFYVIGAIIIFMVTGKLVYEWKMGTNQAQEVIGTVSSIKKEIVERNPKAKFFDDQLF